MAFFHKPSSYGGSPMTMETSKVEITMKPPQKKNGDVIFY